MLEESGGGEEEITSSTNFLLVVHGLLLRDRKYFSEHKDLKTGARSILNGESVLSIESKIKFRGIDVREDA